MEDASALQCKGQSPSSFHILQRTAPALASPSCLQPSSSESVPFVLSQTFEFLHKYRESGKTLLCCGLFGARRWEARTKANSSHGRLVQSADWGSGEPSPPGAWAGVLVWSHNCQSQSGWTEGKVYDLLLLVSCESEVPPPLYTSLFIQVGELDGLRFSPFWLNPFYS